MAMCFPQTPKARMPCYYQLQRVGCAPHLSMARRWHASDSRRQLTCPFPTGPLSVQPGTPHTPTGRIVCFQEIGEMGDGGDRANVSLLVTSPPPSRAEPNKTLRSPMERCESTRPQRAKPLFSTIPKEGRLSPVAPDPRSTGRWTSPDLKRQVSSSHIPHSLSPEDRRLHLRTAAGAPDLSAGRYFSERETRGAGPRVGVP